MKLVSLKLNKKDKKEAKTAMAEPFYGSDYPWGTRLELDDNALEKMRLKVSDFAVGENVRLMAVCSVVAVQQRKDSDGRVELQVVECGLELRDGVEKAFEKALGEDPK